jgi:hypothetical protein
LVIFFLFHIPKAILNKNGLEYTDEEIIQIRDFLYLLAEITTNHFHRKKETDKIKPLTINNHENTTQAESIPLHPGEYRRAG